MNQGPCLSPRLLLLPNICPSISNRASQVAAAAKKLMGESRIGELLEKSWKTWKLAKLAKFRKNTSPFNCLLFVRIFVSLPILMFFFYDFLLIPSVLLSLTNYCFDNRWYLLLTEWGGLSNLYQTWYGVQWFCCGTAGGSHSLIQQFTKIWCTRNIPPHFYV